MSAVTISSLVASGEVERDLVAPHAQQSRSIGRLVAAQRFHLREPYARAGQGTSRSSFATLRIGQLPPRGQCLKTYRAVMTSPMSEATSAFLEAAAEDLQRQLRSSATVIGMRTDDSGAQ